MSQLKKVLITVPDTLLKQVDMLASDEKVNRSEFVREAMKMYIKEKKKISVREQLKRGYKEMAQINISMSQMCFEAENEAFSLAEEKIAECE